MARFGGMTALRAALGGVAGGLEGLGAMREAQRLEEEQRRMTEAKIRAEQRSAISAGGMVAPPDMPGATPRPGYTRQRIGEMEFLFEPEFAKQTRETGHARDAKAFEAKTKAAERTARIDAAVQAAQKAGLDANKVRALMEADPAIQSVLASRLFPAPSVGSGASRRIELSDEEEEKAGRAFIAANARNPKLASALSAAFAQDPAMAGRPGQTAYRLMKRGAVPKMGAATKGYEPPKPPKEDAQRNNKFLSKLNVDVDSSGNLTETPTVGVSQTQATSSVKPAAPAYNKEQDQEYLWAMDAITNLQAPRDEVIREYQKRTGRKWPGMI